jgi:hypothetical protein
LGITFKRNFLTENHISNLSNNFVKYVNAIVFLNQKILTKALEVDVVRTTNSIGFGEVDIIYIKSLKIVIHIFFNKKIWIRKKHFFKITQL